MKSNPETSKSIRVVKTNSCQSLSGKSTITYKIGIDEQSDIVICIQSNSGGGYFNAEWLTMDSILKMLEKHPKVTSFLLRSLYVGKSTNSPGFLLAALLHEKLVHINPDQERNYVALSPDLFMAEIKALIQSLPDSVADTPSIKKASGGKGSPNNKAASKAEVSPLETKSACQSS
jgi:hypothetical protein